ncbi:MAG: hypothetical protein IJ833_10165 [Lachnospiraceae bacterium]|nr:hypothetical protein [Lachnospiraceae bacterium]
MSVDTVSFPGYDQDRDTDIIVIRTLEGGQVVNFYDGFNSTNDSWADYFYPKGYFH